MSKIWGSCICIPPQFLVLALSWGICVLSKIIESFHYKNISSNFTSNLTLLLFISINLLLSISKSLLSKLFMSFEGIFLLFLSLVFVSFSCFINEKSMLLFAISLLQFRGEEFLLDSLDFRVRKAISFHYSLLPLLCPILFLFILIKSIVSSCFTLTAVIFCLIFSWFSIDLL